MTRALNINDPINVQYCAPLWVRDEHIKLAIGRNVGRISGPVDPETRGTEPIAVVCFGPSLNDTWEKIRDFKYIISCSGAHKFLVERGIIPTWHCEVDPRVHKMHLIGPPHPDVEYLIASACHPKVFDHLEGFKVKIWHVFASEAESLRVLPPGEWAVTGGSSIGLRAMAIARHFGFRYQHVFGMDGSFGKSGKHAAYHPSQPNQHSTVDYKGVTYETNPGVLACAKETFHELDQMYDVEATFYGEGLVQAMAKDYVRKPVNKVDAVLGFAKPPLISPEYLALNQRLYRENVAYGVNGARHADTVIRLADTLGTRSVLDYGCGRGYLAKNIPWPIWEYDPAVPGKEETPRSADLVVCTDVLEHIEPDKLALVLGDLSRCVLKIGYFTISTRSSKKSLADGRNAHLIIENRHWWKKRLRQFFHIGKIQDLENVHELHVVVEPKKR